MKPTHSSHAARLGRVNDVARGAFTLTELLVVMGLIALLGVLTAAGYRTIAKDAKLSSGKNTVMAVLDNARGLAMKNNRMVMVVFRPRMDGPKAMYVEAVLCKWTGESYDCPDPVFGVVDRFVPIPNTPVRSLPSGIKIAGPRYAQANGGANGGPGFDRSWITQTQLNAIKSDGTGEQSGGIVAVMYGPDGTVVTRNSNSDSVQSYVDFNDDGKQRRRSTVSSFIDYSLLALYSPAFPTAAGSTAYFDQRFEDDEPLVNCAPFIAVYDDDKARDVRATDWVNLADYKTELIGDDNVAETGGYINQYASRIHFNRYTGVAMK